MARASRDDFRDPTDTNVNGMSPLEVPYGLMLWDKLIRGNDQIFMTLNGHYHGSTRLTKTNDFGNAVDEMVVDYQMAYTGGNGLQRLYEFDLTHNKIKVLSLSPWVTQQPTIADRWIHVAVVNGTPCRATPSVRRGCAHPAQRIEHERHCLHPHHRPDDRGRRRLRKCAVERASGEHR